MSEESDAELLRSRIPSDTVLRSFMFSVHPVLTQERLSLGFPELLRSVSCRGRAPALLKGSSRAGMTERASAQLRGVMCLLSGVSPEGRVAGYDGVSGASRLVLLLPFHFW